MLTVFIAIGTFVTLLLLFQGCYALYDALYKPGAQRAKQRLRAWSAKSNEPQPPASILRRRVLSEVPWLGSLLSRLPRLKSLSRMLEQAGTRLPLGLFLLLSVLLSLIGFLAAGLTTPQLLARLMAGTGGGLLPFLYLYRRKVKRLETLQSQLPDALDLVGRALRAGHPFVVGMKMVAEEFSQPIGGEFDRTVEEITFGLDVPTALKHLVYRVDSADLRFFVTAVIVQRETGGNLAHITESLASIIRKRFELQGRINALAAEGKYSAIILFALPFALAAVMLVLNSEYITILYSDPLGKIMLAGGAMLMLVGIVVTRKMITIRV